MKSLIHYPQFRKISDICDSIRNHKPTLLQKIFSPDLLKSSKTKALAFAGSFMVFPFMGFVAISEFFPYPLSMLESNPISLLVLTIILPILALFPILLGMKIWVLPYLWKSTLASEGDKTKLVEKCNKILSLYPQTNEIIAPLLEHLKNDISFEHILTLEPALDDVLINLDYEGLVLQLPNIGVEDSESCVTPQRIQRLVV